MQINISITSSVPLLCPLDPTRRDTNIAPKHKEPNRVAELSVLAWRRRESNPGPKMLPLRLLRVCPTD